VDRLRATPWWQDLLIIGLPDHCFAKCPPTIMNHEPLRYHIPMFWVGGAVREPRLITTMGSQIDLGATLLARLDLSHEDFNFSKDLKDTTVPHYAFYAWPDGFGFLTDSIRYIQDNANDSHPLEGTYDPDGRAQRWGKAYLQTLYDDLSRR
jgi:phosphoglycerol transferase MdoB-like AlkP superfamily enzyme